MQTRLKIESRHEQLKHNPSFKPINEYQVYIINKFTDLNVLHHLIHLAQNTKYYSIDTQSDLYTNQPALIQIECIHRSLSSVILIEMCHLPIDKTSVRFWLIKSLFKTIFHSSNTMYSWSNFIEELSRFLIYDIFKFDILFDIDAINMQHEFKQWHHQTYKSDQINTNEWGLQAAILATFTEYLDQTQRLNRWSHGLERLHRYDHGKNQLMINYAINQCLSVTKLAYKTGSLN